MSRRRKVPENFRYDESRDVRRVAASPQIEQAFTTEFRETVLHKLAAGEPLAPRLQHGAERYREILRMIETPGWPLPSLGAGQEAVSAKGERLAHRPAVHTARDAQIVREVEFSLTEQRGQRERGWSNVTPDKAAHSFAGKLHGITADNVKVIVQRARKKKSKNPAV